MQDTNKNKQDSLPHRFERRKDKRHQIRVIIQYAVNTVFETTTYDLSNTGLFVLIKSDDILNKIKLNTNIKFFLEFRFDTIIEGLGIIIRINKEEDAANKKGFAINIVSMSENNKVLLQNMIANL